jgi:hypothetical protein
MTASRTPASQATSSRIAGRHHLVSPGDIISESAGDFVGICSLLDFAIDGENFSS